VAEEDALDDGLEDVLLVVGEAGGGLELEAQVVVGAALVRIEDERICADGQRDRELAQDVEGGC
jgi:hypothetical protein